MNGILFKYQIGRSFIMKTLLKRYGVLMLALTLGFLLIAPVQAQSTDDRTERVKQVLSNLQEFLVKAGEIVNESENDEAKALLAQAEEAATEAAVKIEAGELEEALTLIRKSRKLAQDAIRLVRNANGTGHNSNAIKHRMQRELVALRGLEERIKEMIKNKDCPAAQALMEQGQALATEAAEAFAKGEYQDAKNASRRARELYTKALRELVVFGSNVTVHIQKQIDRVDALIAEVAALVKDTTVETEAAALLDSAQDALDKAKEQLAQDEPDLRAVMDNVAKARELAISAKRLLPNTGLTTGGHIEKLTKRHLEKLTDHLVVAHGIVDTCTSDEAKDLLAQAEAKAGEAQVAVDAAEYRTALILINKAQRLCNQAIRLARSCNGTGSTVHSNFIQVTAEKALATWTEYAAKVAPTIEASTDETVLRYWADAQVMAEEAQTAYDEGNYRATVQKISAAIMLANRAAILALRPTHHGNTGGPGSGGSNR
jgi:putative cell wall-binding protein